MRAVLFGLASLDLTGKHGGSATYGKQWGITSLENLPFYGVPLFSALVCLVLYALDLVVTE